MKGSMITIRTPIMGSGLGPGGRGARGARLNRR